MLGLPVHTTADIGNVGKDGLFGAFSGNLGRDDGVTALLPGELGVVCVEEGEESFEKLRSVSGMS